MGSQLSERLLEGAAAAGHAVVGAGVTGALGYGAYQATSWVGDRLHTAPMPADQGQPSK